MKRFNVERNTNWVKYSYNKYSHVNFLLIVIFLGSIVNSFNRISLRDFDSLDIFYLLGILVPAYLLYHTIDTGFNTTLVVTNSEFVIIQEFPIPIRQARRLMRSEIRGFIIKSEEGEVDRTKWENHTIFVRLENRIEVPLFQNIFTLEEAREIKSLLQRDFLLVS